MRYLWITLLFLFLFGEASLSANDNLYDRQICDTNRFIDASKVRNAADLKQLLAKNSGQMVAITNLKLPGANLSGLHLSNLCFVRPELAKTNWRGAKGRKLKFHLANLAGSDWTGYDGKSLTFYVSDLKDAIFVHGRFRSTRFESTTVEHIDARYADLSNSHFSGNWQGFLTDAKFDNANMSGFNFKCGITTGDMCGQYSSNISFRSANLSNAIIDIPSMQGLDFSKVILNNTSVPLHLSRHLQDARLNGRVTIIPAPWNATYDVQHKTSLSAVEFRQLADNILELRASAEQPSFDCRNARTKAENFICDVKPNASATRFAAADTELQRAYDAARPHNRALVSAQRRWLKDRDSCLNQSTDESKREDCFFDKYNERIETLWNMAPTGIDLAVGEKMLFASAADNVASSFRSTKLFRKLARTFAVNSWSYVFVERLKNRRLYAQGIVIGGNEGLGSLGSPSKGLVFDKKSRCFGTFADMSIVKPTSDQFYPIIRIRGDRLEEGNQCSVDPRPEYNDYIMLGARASFDPMVRLPLSTKDIDDLLRLHKRNS